MTNGHAHAIERFYGKWLDVKRFHLLKTLFLFLLQVSWMTACAGSSTPTEKVPDGWMIVETVDFTIWLPSTWEAHPITAENAQAEFAIVEKVNPIFAQSLGGAERLKEISLWAYDVESEDSEYHDNMNVSYVPMEDDRVQDLKPIQDTVEAEYTDAGADVTDSKLYQVNGQPALHIAYSFNLAKAGGQPVVMEGHQYFLVAGSNVWILSYNIDPSHLADAAALVERSAGSFHALK